VVGCVRRAALPCGAQPRLAVPGCRTRGRRSRRRGCSRRPGRMVVGSGRFQSHGLCPLLEGGPSETRAGGIRCRTACTRSVPHFVHRAHHLDACGLDARVAGDLSVVTALTIRLSTLTRPHRAATVIVRRCRGVLPRLRGRRRNQFADQTSEAWRIAEVAQPWKTPPGSQGRRSTCSSAPASRRLRLRAETGGLR